MQAIVIPLKVSGIGAANRQIQQMGRNLSRLNGMAQVNMRIQGGAGGNRQLQMAAPRVARAPKPPQTFSQKLGGVVASSRFGAGGIMPLVGQTAKLLGPFGTAILIAAQGAKMLAEETIAAAKRLQEFGDAKITGGGSTMETAMARLIGDATGGKSRAFSDAISSDPFAAGAASRAGIYDPGGALFGPIDKTKFYLRWDRYLRGRPLEDAIREARRTGTEDLVKNRFFTKLTDMTNAGTASATATGFSQDKVAAAINFNRQLENVGENFKSLSNVMVTDLIKGLNMVLPAINGILIAGTKIADNPLFKAITKMGLIGDIYDKFFANKEDKDAALKANTASLQALEATIKQGVYGGGERARGAVPRAWMGAGENKWAGQAASLGAFNL